MNDLLTDVKKMIVSDCRDVLRVEKSVLTKLCDEIKVLREALDAALDHQISNRGTRNAFYRCYSGYAFGKMPDWVTKAYKALAAKEGN